MEKHINFQNISFFFSNSSQYDLSHELKLLAMGLRGYLAGSQYNFEVNINLISSDEIRQVNKEYRKKDKATDVLSFPMQESFRNDEYFPIENKLVLGDLLIADEICYEQAKGFGITYEDEFLHLCVHGIMHLLGYDHEVSDKEEALMIHQEQILIDKISEIKKRPQT